MISMGALFLVTAQPTRMVPPYTIMEGRLNLPIAMRQPGWRKLRWSGGEGTMFLSQPGREMLASYHWPSVTVSILSAMMSRL